MSKKTFIHCDHCNKQGESSTASAGWITIALDHSIAGASDVKANMWVNYHGRWTRYFGTSQDFCSFKCAMAFFEKIFEDRES